MPFLLRTLSKLQRVFLLAALLGLTACGGQTEALWPTGILRYRGKGQPGAEEGLWSYRYRDGQLREQGRYRNGRRTGSWTQWHLNGQRANEGERSWSERTQASERVGLWRSWHENGWRRSEGRYVDGVREGEWSFWNDKGQPNEAKSGNYQAGKKIGPSAAAPPGR